MLIRGVVSTNLQEPMPKSTKRVGGSFCWIWKSTSVLFNIQNWTKGTYSRDWKVLQYFFYFILWNFSRFLVIFVEKLKKFRQFYRLLVRIFFAKMIFILVEKCIRKFPSEMSFFKKYFFSGYPRCVGGGTQDQKWKSTSVLFNFH